MDANQKLQDFWMQNWILNGTNAIAPQQITVEVPNIPELPQQ